MKPAELAPYIDHTLLKPDATKSDIRKLCEGARTYGFATVCVNPVWVGACSHWLSSFPVKVCAVVGFPLGANLTNIKTDEALTACRAGAKEIDMVINIGMLKTGNFQYVHDDIKRVRRAVRQTTQKVIIEACLLTEEEKVTACQIAEDAGADFVKTSTGFAGGGATVEDVALMRRVVGYRIGVKAAGGIRTFEQAVAMVEAGANRLGCSASVDIVSEKKEDKK